MKRVQVKSSSVTIGRKSYSAQYQIPFKQLKEISLSPIYYIFVARKKDGSWTTPLIIKQKQLLDHFQNNNVGSRHKNNINLYFTCLKASDNVKCSGQDFTIYIKDYTDFPIIEH